jgi:AhpC/TSA family
VILFSIPKADTCESYWAMPSARALSVTQRVARRRRADSAISTLVSRNTTLPFTVLVTTNRRLRRNGDSRYATSTSTVRHMCETLTFHRHTQKEFPYPLLSDPDRVLVAALGAKNPQGKTKRGHFIFTKGGKLVERKLPVSPGDRYVIVRSRSQNPSTC